MTVVSCEVLLLRLLDLQVTERYVYRQLLGFQSLDFHLYSNREYNKILYKFQNQLSFHTSCICFVMPKHDKKNRSRNTTDCGEKCYGYLMTFGIYEYVSGKRQSKRHVDITYMGPRDIPGSYTSQSLMFLVFVCSGSF